MTGVQTCALPICRGGDLVRLELLKYSDAADPLQHVVLFDQSAQRVYLAQTGLVTTQPGISLPNHLTLMQALPGERTLTDGAKSLTLVFESPEVGGTRLVKTYTFNRGEYTVAVKHEFRNGSAAAISPQLYLQLTRDGNAPAGESSFYSTFTGPAMYTEASKFRKIEFKEIEKGGIDHDKTSDSGWVGMVQHYFATAWLANDKTQREFRTAKVSNNLYAIAMVLPLGEVAPGASKSSSRARFGLGFAYAWKGMYEEAVGEFKKVISIQGSTTTNQCYLAYALAMSGKKSEARSILDKLKTTKEYVSPAELASLYVGLGDKDLAIASLEKAYAAHDLQLQYLKVDPDMDSLRSDPRFAELMRKVGLPQR